MMNVFGETRPMDKPSLLSGFSLVFRVEASKSRSGFGSNLKNRVKWRRLSESERKSIKRHEDNN